MEGRRLIFSDNSVIEGAEAGYYDGTLWLYIPECTMAHAIEIGMNTARNNKITFQYGEMEDEYIGYTVCATLSVNSDGLASICLKKPAA